MRCELSPPELVSADQGGFRYSEQKRMRPTQNNWTNPQSSPKWSHAVNGKAPNPPPPHAHSLLGRVVKPSTSSSRPAIRGPATTSAHTVPPPAPELGDVSYNGTSYEIQPPPKQLQPATVSDKKTESDSSSNESREQKTPEQTPDPSGKDTPARESRLSDYQEGRVIGEGSFAKVSQVTLKSTKKTYVWKALNYGTMTGKEKQMLVDEVNILRELDHANIVKYYDRIIVHKERKIYIVQEFCDAGDLAQLIKKQRQKTNNGHKKYFQEDFIWSVLSEVASALHACHCRPRYGKILHRDLKPGNIFLSQVGSSKYLTVKLGDFGLARILTKDIFAETCVGTPYYMSPELIKKGRYDEKSDIWALGCIVYEMATLYPPFRARGYNELAQKIQQGIFKSLPQDENGYIYSKELWEILRSMLQINPEHRASIDDIRKNPCVKLAETLSGTRQKTAKQKKHSEAVKKREHDLNIREKAVKARENKLKMQEADLNGRRDSLNIKEKAIASKEKEVRDKMQLIQQHKRSSSCDRLLPPTSDATRGGSLTRSRTMSPMPLRTASRDNSIRSSSRDRNNRSSSRDRKNNSLNGSSAGKSSLGSNSNQKSGSSNDSSQKSNSNSFPLNFGPLDQQMDISNENSSCSPPTSREMGSYNGGNSNHTSGSSGDHSGRSAVMEPVTFEQFLPRQPGIQRVNPGPMLYTHPSAPPYSHYPANPYPTPGGALPVVGENVFDGYGSAQPPWPAYNPAAQGHNHRGRLRRAGSGRDVRQCGRHPVGQMYGSAEPMYGMDRRPAPVRPSGMDINYGHGHLPAGMQRHNIRQSHSVPMQPRVPEAPPAPVPQPGKLSKRGAHRSPLSPDRAFSRNAPREGLRSPRQRANGARLSRDRYSSGSVDRSSHITESRPVYENDNLMSDWDKEVKEVSLQMEKSVRLPNAFNYGRYGFQEHNGNMTDTSTTFESLMTKKSFRGQRT